MEKLQMSKTAVIIGYGPGVGAASAQAFAAEGYALALLARNTGKVEAAAHALTEAGQKAHAFPADAADEASLTQALHAAREALGDPEVLLYNAAHWRPGPVLSVSAEDLVVDVRTCVAGALTAARIVTPAMRAAGRGSILFTGGGFALYPSPMAPALSIGKAGIRALAHMLAEELAPDNIRVGTVTIMGVVTPGTALAPEKVAEAFIALHHGAPDPKTAETMLRG